VCGWDLGEFAVALLALLVRLSSFGWLSTTAGPFDVGSTGMLVAGFVCVCAVSADASGAGWGCCVCGKWVFW
jgi:hypothetical protein